MEWKVYFLHITALFSRCCRLRRLILISFDSNVDCEKKKEKKNSQNTLNLIIFHFQLESPSSLA